MAGSTTYTGAVVKWSDAVELTRRGAGNLFVLVVREKRRNALDIDMTYGYFFRERGGEIVDVQKQSAQEIRTQHKADKVLEELAAIYEGRIPAFEIQTKTPENVVKQGEITDAILPPYAFREKDGTA